MQSDIFMVVLMEQATAHNEPHFDIS